MLGCVVTADSAVREGTGQGCRVREVEEVGDRGHESSSLAWRNGGATRGCCAVNRGACSCSHCARRTGRSSHLRPAWGEEDHDRLQNPGVSRGGDWEWRRVLLG